MKKLLGTAATAVMLGSALLVEGQPAHATSDSGNAYFDNGERLTANMWIQPVAEGGCGSFQSSAVATTTTNWIRNNTDFYQYGIGSVTVKGVSIDNSRSGDSSLVWTNTNASGSYLSGTVCGGWGSVYVGADVTATAYHYGNVRVASARV
ncbi:hypothetical protein [Nesterenkonia suensis]